MNGVIGRDDFRRLKQAEFDNSINKEAVDAYWKKVKEPVSSVDFAIKRAMSGIAKSYSDEQFMDIEQAKPMAWALLNDYCMARGFEYDLSPTNKAILLQLTKYFINDSSCKLDRRKGLMLIGGTGSGKTTLMRSFSRFANALQKVDGYDRAFKIESCKNIVNEVRFGDSSVLRKYTFDNYCFDDLGFEPSDAKVWGNNVSVMGDLLADRYDRFVVSGVKTHITTNLIDKDLEAKYGQRIFSRMQEMFNWILVDNKDYRIK